MQKDVLNVRSICKNVLKTKLQILNAGRTLSGFASGGNALKHEHEDDRCCLELWQWRQNAQEPERDLKACVTY